MSQESDVCCTTSMYDIQNRCIPDEIDLFYFKTCIITHNNNVIEQNINVSMFDNLSVKEPHRYSLSHRTKRGNSLHLSSNASVEFLLPVFSLSDHVKISQFPCRIKENFYHLMTSH